MMVEIFQMESSLSNLRADYWCFCSVVFLRNNIQAVNLNLLIIIFEESYQRL